MIRKPSKNPPSKKTNPGASDRPVRASPSLCMPSVYRYTCWGSFRTDDESKRMVCRGFPSQMSLIESWPLTSSRDEAVQDFVKRIEYRDGGSEVGGSSTVVMEDELILSKSKKNNNNNNDYGDTNTAKSIKCFGKTDVEVLVLQQEGKEKLVGVAPHCSFGTAVRKDKAVADRKTLSLNLGLLEIKFLVESESDSDSYTTESEEQMKGRLSEESRRRMEHNRNQDDLDNDDKRRDNREDDLVQNPANPFPFPSQSTLQFVNALAEWTPVYLRKFSEHFKSNILFLWHNLEDRYPQRVLAASQRVCREIPKTVERTGKGMKEIYRRVSGDDEEDDEEDE